jgi:hypothetical protein
MVRNSCLGGGRGLILIIAMATEIFHILAPTSAHAADRAIRQRYDHGYAGGLAARTRYAIA